MHNKQKNRTELRICAISHLFEFEIMVQRLSLLFDLHLIILARTLFHA